MNKDRGRDKERMEDKATDEREFILPVRRVPITLMASRATLRDLGRAYWVHRWDNSSMAKICARQNKPPISIKPRGQPRGLAPCVCDFQRYCTTHTYYSFTLQVVLLNIKHRHILTHL